MKSVCLKILIIFVVVSNSLQGQNSSTLSEAEKIFGLSKIWKEADKNFVFFDQIPEINWDSTYLHFLPIVKSTETDYEYFKELQRFYSILKDGHTRVYVPGNLIDIHEAEPPLKLEFINGKIVIDEVQNDTLREMGLRRGMEILEIAGEEVKQYAEKNIAPFVFYSTPEDKDVQVYERNLLKGHIDRLLRLKTKIDGSIQEYTISRRLIPDVSDEPVFEYTVHENGIGILKIFRFWGDDFEEEFDSIFHLVKESTKLLIDVSDNSGGYSVNADYVLKHFVRKSYRKSSWKTFKYLPAYVAEGREIEWEDFKGLKVHPVNRFRRYRGKVVLLISEKTYSAAEDFTSAFLGANRGKVIGRPTAGTTGNSIVYDLLGVTWFQICSKRDYLVNGEEFVGFGIKPQIYIEESIDETLLIEKGMQMLKNE